MQKILLVIQREYLTRVRKRSFVVMTLVAPLLLSLFYGIIIYFAVNRDIGDTQKSIYVEDVSGVIIDKLQSTEQLHFISGQHPSAGYTTDFFNETHTDAVLIIPDTSLTNVSLLAVNQPSITLMSTIEDQLASIKKQSSLEKLGMNSKVLEDIMHQSVNISTSTVSEKGAESSSAQASSVIGYISALIIYLFIFMYGVQVMRGVIEEKTNRIVEVIISSLSPFELMMGKIIGIAMVGLTQFCIWVVLIVMLTGSGGLLMGQDTVSASPELANSGEFGQILAALAAFDYVYLLLVFVFYFISGYLFYGALFAAIGSAVDSETDTQQFMLPVTMPLVLSLVLAQSAIISNPHGPLAFWLSVIPFTSPIAMMVRVPFGVDTWELLLSMGLMIVGFTFTVWVASRIYRVGILMYGKKANYKELAKWFFIR
jgi:ABC-2 type transport system permease protein